MIWDTNQNTEKPNPISKLVVKLKAEVDEVEAKQETLQEGHKKIIMLQKKSRKHPRKDVLLPHDTVSDVKTFYSYTPLALRCKNLDEKKMIEIEYTHAKLTGKPIEVAATWHNMN